jgi:hypothetical protein
VVDQLVPVPTGAGDINGSSGQGGTGFADGETGNATAGGTGGTVGSAGIYGAPQALRIAAFIAANAALPYMRRETPGVTGSAASCQGSSMSSSVTRDWSTASI